MSNTIAFQSNNTATFCKKLFPWIAMSWNSFVRCCKGIINSNYLYLVEINIVPNISNIKQCHNA